MIVRIRLFSLLSMLVCFAVVTVAESKEQSIWNRHTIDDSSRGADGVRLADVNHDGLMDIVTGWEEGGCIRVYLNPGPDKVFDKWPAVTVGNVKSPEDAVFADLDGDGSMDVVSCCEGNVKTVFVHWGPSEMDRYLDSSHWRTEAIPVTEKKTAWMFCLPMQIDGKHGIDLIVGAKGENAEVGWLEAPQNPRDLSTWRYHTLYRAGWIMSLIASDMDADGDLDVLLSDRKGETRGCLWLENPGPENDQTTVWPEHRIGKQDMEFMFIDIADVDQDGLEDVVAAVRGEDIAYHKRISQETSEMWKTLSISMPPNTGTGKGVQVADIDLDGKRDVVFTCEHAEGKSGVMWLSYRDQVTESNWDAHEIGGQVGIKFDRIELLDLDEDGDLDLMTCEERSNLGVIWYENPTR